MKLPRLNAEWLKEAQEAAAGPRAGHAPGSPATAGAHSSTADKGINGIESRGASLPIYHREACGVGIVHLGVGNFHRAHQAVYTDEVLARQSGDWRILGVSLRSENIARILNEQDGLYTLLIRGEGGTHAHVIGSIAGAVAASCSLAPVLTALISPKTRIVTLTVTEKAYGIDRVSGAVSSLHPAVMHDLANPDQPAGVLGLLVWGLRHRRQRQLAPFSVLCCDNLPENGRLLRAGVCDLAERTEAGLGGWIAEHVAFPCSMVDRITPSPTDQTLRDAALATGCDDLAAVETEPFSMWVVEDHFPAGRPAWDRAGALMVHDVAPYERMKLRMLNGAHSLLAYAGHVAGHAYVRDAMRDDALSRRVDEYLRAAAATLQPLPAVDFSTYAADLQRRFANPSIAHKTSQIAMDGTEKLPQRILEAAEDSLAKEMPTRIFAFATAAWMRYCLGITDAGEQYDLNDPRAGEITSAVRRVSGAPHAPDLHSLRSYAVHAPALSAALMGLPGLFPPSLLQSPAWREQVSGYLRVMLDKGMTAALQDAG